ncbi:MAG TPA: hypothetical protein VK034_27065 [Enhygromyxa sp.]|nr:hypothetical protein [Enhygromyxa sp.]
MSDALVPLCSCYGIVQAQAIRASLEARGVPTLIDGEHQRNILGMFGTVVALRIMVPRSQLRLAYQLAVEIIPDLPEPEFDEEHGEAEPPEPLPLRRALPEDLLEYPDDEEPDDALAEDDEAEQEEDDLAELRERRTLLGPRLGFALGTTLAIVTILYGNLTRGLVLAAVMLALAYLRVLPLTAAKPEQRR